MKCIKYYLLSILCFLVIGYLSFFKPPSIGGVSEIPHFDKIVHFCMYFGFSAILWHDYWRRIKRKSPKAQGWYVACLLPILISGLIELGQQYFTTYRGGDWLDFIANSLGAITASVIAYFYLRKVSYKMSIKS